MSFQNSRDIFSPVVGGISDVPDKSEGAQVSGKSDLIFLNLCVYRGYAYFGPLGIWADKLENKKTRLLDIVQKIQWETESNTYLLRYAIDFTHSIIQLSDTAIKNQLGYSKTGSKSLNVSPTKLLDHKA